MGKNVTEQQRIAAALESMVDTSDSEGKKNVTEQQRIASAIEAIAEGGGGGGGNAPVYVHLKQENGTWQLDGITFDELMALCKAEKCIGAIYVRTDTSGDTPLDTYSVFPLTNYSEYENGVYFEVDYIVGTTLWQEKYIVYSYSITKTEKQYTLTEKT